MASYRSQFHVSLQHDNAKTLAAHGDFLTLWKNADPAPHLQAQADYAKFQKQRASLMWKGWLRRD